MMMIIMKVLLRAAWKMADVMMINVREREEIDNVNKVYFTSSYQKLARKILLVPILY